MCVTCKQALPIVCVSLILCACGNSGSSASATSGNADGADIADAASEFSDGTTGGVTTDEGVGTTGGGTDILGATAIPDIQGLWATQCLLTEGATNEGRYNVQTISVVGSRLRHESEMYSDQECTMPVDLGLPVSGATVQQLATTVSNNNFRTTTLGDAAEVDFHFEDATVDSKPLSTEGVDSLAGYAARVEYNIVLVQEKILYLGDTALAGYDGSSAAMRPISLDAVTQFDLVPN